MARRATSALSAVLASAALALSVTVLASHQPATAATSQQADGQISIVITGMTPQWATPRSTITLTGTLRNNSKSPATQLTVWLYGSSTPVASLSVLRDDASQRYSPATTPLGTRWQATAPLAPGASTNWSIQVRAGAINMARFGVYPLAAQVQDQYGIPATATTFLPYEPDRKGPYASSRPAPAKIAWLWPLIDIPLLNEPWQGNCSGPQASALAQSLGSGGRLAELVQAGGTDQDLTWVVDPAVLANAQALTGCQSLQPEWARAASSWLASVRAETAGRPLTVTPYGDPNSAALIAVGRDFDVTRSFVLGRGVAGEILNHRDLNPAAGASTTNAATSPLTQAAGIAWSAVGVPGLDTVENLANAGHIHTLVLSTSAFPGGPTVVKTPDAGGYLTALRASQSLTQLLGSGSRRPGSAFDIDQLFLSETALLAQELPAQPIVVAPPPRWAPPAALATGLLGDTHSAPWLSQTSLTTLASARHIPLVPTQTGPGSLGPTRITRHQLHKIRTVSRDIEQLDAIRAKPYPGLYLALSALESSALQGAPSATSDAMLAAVARRVVAEQQGVRIIAEKRITLGGLKGSVPVSIENRLGYAIKVQLQLQYNQGSGVRIAADPPGLITVPAHQTQTIRLRVQAAEVGSTTVTMLLATRGDGPLTVPLRMTIQATQVGVLGMIIVAAALGVFLLASAVRAMRRGRPGTVTDQPASDAPGDDHDQAGSADTAEADTVNAERAELGAVGKPGP